MELEDMMHFVDSGLDQVLDALYPEAAEGERSESMRRMLEVWRSPDYKEDLKACTRGLVSPEEYPEDAARFQDLMHTQDGNEILQGLPRPNLQPLGPQLLNPDKIYQQGKLMGCALKILLTRKHLEKFGTRERSKKESDLGSDSASKD